MYRSIGILCWWRRRYIGSHGVFLAQAIIEGVLCVVAYAMFVYVCQEHRLSFSNRVPVTGVITDHRQSAKDTDTYYKSRPMWKTLAHLPWLGFEPITSCRQSVLLLLANIKALNFKQLNQSGFSILWRSFPVINISKSYRFIQDSWLAKLPLSNWCAERACRNHEVMFSDNSEW